MACPHGPGFMIGGQAKKSKPHNNRVGVAVSLQARQMTMLPPFPVAMWFPACVVKNNETDGWGRYGSILMGDKRLTIPAAAK